jgi:hypothetical protein
MIQMPPDHGEVSFQIIIQHFKEERFFIFKIGVETADGNTRGLHNLFGIGSVDSLACKEMECGFHDPGLGLNASFLLWCSYRCHLFPFQCGAIYIQQEKSCQLKLYEPLFMYNKEPINIKHNNFY